MKEIKLYPRHFLNARYENAFDCPIARWTKEHFPEWKGVYVTTFLKDICTPYISTYDRMVFLLDQESEEFLKNNFEELQEKALQSKEDEVIHTVFIKD